MNVSFLRWALARHSENSFWCGVTTCVSPWLSHTGCLIPLVGLFISWRSLGRGLWVGLLIVRVKCLQFDHVQSMTRRDTSSILPLGNIANLRSSDAKQDTSVNSADGNISERSKDKLNALPKPNCSRGSLQSSHVPGEAARSPGFEPQSNETFWIDLCCIFETLARLYFCSRFKARMHLRSLTSFFPCQAI